MSLKDVLCVAAVVLSVLHTIPAQVASTAAGNQLQLQRDATAIAAVQRSLVAMGSAALASYQDSTANGSVTIYGDKSQVTFPITLQSKGLHQVRYDLQKSRGIFSYVTDGSIPCIKDPISGSRLGEFTNLYGQRIDYIPALSILSEYTNSNVNVQYAGTATVNGQPADVITVSSAVDSPPGFDALRLTQHWFYIDQKTSLVSKMQFWLFWDRQPSASFKAEMYFSNYQSISGIAVPFSRSMFFDGVLDSTLTLSSVAFNSGLADSVFAITCGVQNGQ